MFQERRDGDDTSGYTGMSVCRDARSQSKLTASVEDLDKIAVGDAARCSIVLVHLERRVMGVFHLLVHG